MRSVFCQELRHSLHFILIILNVEDAHSRQCHLISLFPLLHLLHVVSSPLMAARTACGARALAEPIAHLSNGFGMSLLPVGGM